MQVYRRSHQLPGEIGQRLSGPLLTSRKNVPGYQRYPMVPRPRHPKEFRVRPCQFLPTFGGSGWPLKLLPQAVLTAVSMRIQSKHLDEGQYVRKPPIHQVLLVAFPSEGKPHNLYSDKSLYYILKAVIIT